MRDNTSHDILSLQVSRSLLFVYLVSGSLGGVNDYTNDKIIVICLKASTVVISYLIFVTQIASVESFCYFLRNLLITCVLKDN